MSKYEEMMALARTIVMAMNDMLDHDPDAIGNLVKTRVPCNAALADHPTCQVMPEDVGGPMVGLVGVLNGICGVHEDGSGVICAGYDEHDNVIYFALRHADGHVEMPYDLKI